MACAGAMPFRRDFPTTTRILIFQAKLHGSAYNFNLSVDALTCRRYTAVMSVLGIDRKPSTWSVITSPRLCTGVCSSASAPYTARGHTRTPLMFTVSGGRPAALARAWTSTTAAWRTWWRRACECLRPARPPTTEEPSRTCSSSLTDAPPV
jgi:hypothetical protein